MDALILFGFSAVLLGFGIYATLIRANQEAAERSGKSSSWKDSLATLWPNAEIISYMSDQEDSGIALNEVAQRFALRTPSSFRSFAANACIGTAILFDGAHLPTQKTSHSLANAVIGGVIAGPAGAVVGALAKIVLVKRVELQITINDMAAPDRRVTFYAAKRGSFGLRTDDPAIKEAIAAARLWESRLKLLSAPRL